MSDDVHEQHVTAVLSDLKASGMVMSLAGAVPRAKQPHVIEIYMDRKRDWRWRLKAGNRIIQAGSAGDGYRRPGACRKALEQVRLAMASAEIVVVKGKARG